MLIKKTMSDNYKRIVYPERAEYLVGESAFRGYGWAELFGNRREHRMLESEWNLKVIVAGDVAVAALLAGDIRAKRLIDESTVYHAPGTQKITKGAYNDILKQIDEELSTTYPIVNNSHFWALGSRRNNDYEAKLKLLYPSYNTKGSGFLGARPDIVIDDYIPCSILRSVDNTQTNLNAAIRRDANVVEFTVVAETCF